MADRPATPPFSQPRKPPADIQGATSEEPLNALFTVCHDDRPNPASTHQRVLDLSTKPARPQPAKPAAAAAAANEAHQGTPSFTQMEEKVPPIAQRSSRDPTPRDETKERLGQTMTTKTDELHSKMAEFRNLFAREKRRLKEQQKCSIGNRQMPMLLRPVGFSSKGGAYQGMPSISERSPSPAMRQRMDLLKAQKHRITSTGHAEKLEAARKRRDDILAEKMGANQKKEIRLPDQYTTTVLNPLKLAKDGEAYTVSLTTRARSPSPAVHERLSRSNVKEPTLMAVEQVRRHSASAERRHVMLEAKKNQARLKREELARVCRERAAQIEADQGANGRDPIVIPHVGNVISSSEEEASLRQFALDLTVKLGLSEVPLPDYMRKKTDATLKSNTTGLIAGPQNALSSSGRTLLGSLPPVVPAPRKTHSLLTSVKASWWMENKRNRQMAELRRCGNLSPLPPRDKPAREELSKGQGCDISNTRANMSAYQTDKDSLHKSEITDPWSPGHQVVQNKPPPHAVEGGDESEDDVSVIDDNVMCQELVKDSSDEDDDLSVETLVLADEAPRSPTPSPASAGPLSELSTPPKASPKSDAKQEHKRKNFLPKLLRSLKPCCKGNDDSLKDAKLSDNKWAETASMHDATILKRVRAFFNHKKNATKPYKTSKVTPIRIIDGEVHELDDSKKGLRKFLCWK